jgi:hypothetical protein
MELARAAEEAGWDGYFLWDGTAHPYRPVLEPWIGLAVVAQATSRIVIGPMVAAVPNYSPAQLEALVGSLAQLAPDRIVLGAGLGDAPADKSPGRAARLEAGLRAVRDAHPHVPVWLGARDPLKQTAPVHRAREWDGLFPMGIDRPLDEVQSIAREVSPPGDRPFDLAVGVSWLAENRTQDIARHEAAGVTWLIETLLPWVVPFDAAIDRVRKSGTLHAG